MEIKFQKWISISYQKNINLNINLYKYLLHALKVKSRQIAYNYTSY